MAFTAGSLTLGALYANQGAGEDKSALETALSAGITSLSAVGGNAAVANSIAAFLRAWREQSPDTQRLLSANRTVSVGVSSTTALLTVQFQIVAAA